MAIMPMHSVFTTTLTRQMSSLIYTMSPIPVSADCVAMIVVTIPSLAPTPFLLAYPVGAEKAFDDQDYQHVYDADGWAIPAKSGIKI